MESVDKLRDYCDKLRNVDDNHVSAEYVAERCAIDVRRMADEIEREVAERYMKLPVDADGEPIRVGDKMEHGEYGSMVVDAVAPCGISVFKQNGFTLWAPAFKPDAWHHFKPRTVEDVLIEMLDRNSDGIGLREFNRDFAAFVGHYADEIRELLEVD